MTSKDQPQGGGGLGPTPTTSTAQGGSSNPDQERIKKLSQEINKSKNELNNLYKRVDTNIRFLSKDIPIEDFEINFKLLEKAITNADYQYSTMIKAYEELNDQDIHLISTKINSISLQTSSVCHCPVRSLIHD